ncbi:uncharacterized protein LOC106176709 [Lingula anatina]|uniref:Uncharacterized protein LOC106176709 n=1 Tax=Lingula anatina TaxID=7574 RepID=A0A1S3JX89_LINAN|nr:uncharacterized protein LOC106176709 [Lingula anatina]|eukprot:XP_013414654.1 uncharacterized protein LOC106176709 [Lingula anatina]
MDESRQLRNSTKKELFGESYREINEFKSTGKLPSGTQVIGRMLALCKKPAKGQKAMSRDTSSKIVANELRQDGISKNVYPMHERSVARKIKADYERFNDLRKMEQCKEKTRTDEWFKSANDFNDMLTKHAYNIRTNDPAYQKQLEDEFGVKMTKEDEAFYEDNCFGCYKAVCTSTVPKHWKKKQKRKHEREQSAANKKAATVSSLEEQKRLDESEMSELLNTQIDSGEIDPLFTGPQMSNTSPFQERKLRSSKDDPNVKETDKKQGSPFPQIKIRTGRRSLNESLMRCIVQCLAETRMSPDEVATVVVRVANMVFGQNWKKQNEKDDENDETESDEESEPTESSPSVPGVCCLSNDLTFVFPSRRSIMRYLQDASYLSLEYVAQQILNKEDSIVTVGLDDTTKAAGHRRYDVKADHITIAGPSGKRTTLTTGYVENVSHSGEDGAKAYEFKLKCLAILANSTVDELKSEIDFWMTDRAADCEVLLQTLGVDPSKILKCCAHIILGIDHAIDKVFKNTEQKIGIHQLLEVSAGEKVFLSPGSSIHTLGLIAISKLLSPSHAQHSVSLYNDFKSWMADNNIPCQGFKGFEANRFGRIAELAKEYLSWRESIQTFFDAVVDTNSNKLVLAVATFIQNEWFTCCSEIYTMIGHLIIFPMMELLGIDKMGNQDTADRTWAGVKSFLEGKQVELEKIMLKKRGEAESGRDKLVAAVIEEVIDTLKNQMSKTDYFRRSDVDSDDDMKYAPLTNLGCESEFSKLDHRIKVTGGSSSVQTLSRKNLLASSGLLVHSQFESKSAAERKERWKWARCSEEVKAVQKLETDFLATVESAKKLALHKKEELKKKKACKTLAVLERCKDHNGPLTVKSLDLLPSLTEKQLLDEINYLRLTVAPDIRQKRRVKAADGKFRMEKFTVEELKASIKNALKPEATVNEDINALLLSVQL